MGKTRRKACKPVAKKCPKLATAFDCPFCNVRGAVACKMDHNLGLAILTCDKCNQGFETRLTLLTEPIDAYHEWLDACEDATLEEVATLSRPIRAPSPPRLLRPAGGAQLPVAASPARSAAVARGQAPLAVPTSPSDLLRSSAQAQPQRQGAEGALPQWAQHHQSLMRQQQQQQQALAGGAEGGGPASSPSSTLGTPRGGGGGGSRVPASGGGVAKAAAAPSPGTGRLRRRVNPGSGGKGAPPPKLRLPAPDTESEGEREGGGGGDGRRPLQEGGGGGGGEAAKEIDPELEDW